MYIEAPLLITLVVGGAFMLWLYLSEENAKKRKQQETREQDLKYELLQKERELNSAKLSAQEWKDRWKEELRAKID